MRGRRRAAAHLCGGAGDGLRRRRRLQRPRRGGRRGRGAHRAHPAHRSRPATRGLGDDARLVRPHARLSRSSRRRSGGSPGSPPGPRRRTTEADATSAGSKNLTSRLINRFCLAVRDAAEADGLLGGLQRYRGVLPVPLDHLPRDRRAQRDRRAARHERRGSSRDHERPARAARPSSSTASGSQGPQALEPVFRHDFETRAGRCRAATRRGRPGGVADRPVRCGEAPGGLRTHCVDSRSGCWADSRGRHRPRP